MPGSPYLKIERGPWSKFPLVQQATVLYWQVGSWFLILFLFISNLSLPLVVCFSNASSPLCQWPSLFQRQLEHTFLYIKATYFNNPLISWIAVFKISTFTGRGIVQRGRKNDLFRPRYKRHLKTITAMLLKSTWWFLFFFSNMEKHVFPNMGGDAD